MPMRVIALWIICGVVNMSDKRRFGDRHYYLLEYDNEGNARGLHIYDQAWDRNIDMGLLRRLGRHVSVAGTREARVYMVHCIRAVDPDSHVSLHQGSCTINEVIETFEKVCLGVQTLFD